VTGFAELRQNESWNIDGTLGLVGALEQVPCALAQSLAVAIDGPDSACVSVTASGGVFGSTGLSAERGQLLLPQRVCIASHIGKRIVNSVGDPPAPNQLKGRRRLRVTGLNFPQSLGRRFQLVEIRLAHQYGVVLVATTNNHYVTKQTNCRRQNWLLIEGDGEIVIDYVQLNTHITGTCERAGTAVANPRAALLCG
jgi:hypothetical protein